MNPELELFLEEAFASLKQVSGQIGRVVVEPDYDAAVNAEDASALREELVAFVNSQRPPDKDLRSHDGFETPITGQFALLKKYLRRISLHSDAINGEWVEVVPPGNWI
ncbi:MAG: hypothetical protein JO270_20425 [Acidobacteriaceae bacterium]|nr:hypothetical protein [Acidobacteriaceae bacterium]MBV8570637.1 hypothetical protein [Acidobacteriaceae bacterium]